MFSRFANVIKNASVRGRAGFSTSTSSAAPAAEAAPYPRVLQAFHWIVGGGTIACFGLVQAAQRTEDKEKKGQYMFIHKSIGTLLLGIVVPRLFIRAATKVPVGYGMPAWQQLASKISHAALYGLTVFMPVSGVAMGYFGGKGLPFFFTTIPGAAEPNGAVAKQAYLKHKQVGQFFEYFFFPVHVGAVAFHGLRGQNVLRRMIAGPK